MSRAILSLAFLFATGIAWCQVQFGITAGVTYVNTVSDYTPSDPFSFDNSFIERDYLYKPSYQIGVFIKTPLTDKLALRSELLLSAKGSKIEVGPSTSNLKLTYLNMPVLLQILPIQKFGIEMGPELGYLLSAKQKSDDVKDLYEAVDLGLSTGIRYYFSNKISLNLRYTHGLKKIQEEVFFGPITNFREEIAEFRNRSFHLSVSYGIKK